MADLYLDEGPEQQLTRLETDPNLATVLRSDAALRTLRTVGNTTHDDHETA